MKLHVASSNNDNLIGLFMSSAQTDPGAKVTFLKIAVNRPTSLTSNSCETHNLLILRNEFYYSITERCMWVGTRHQKSVDNIDDVIVTS